VTIVLAQINFSLSTFSIALSDNKTGMPGLTLQTLLHRTGPFNLNQC